MSGAGPVAVIIPTLGRTTLQAVLDGLTGQTRQADEIVVVEDGGRRGAAWARNQGLARTAAPWLAFIDDDAVPPPHWLATMLAVRDAFHADVVAGTYEESDPLLAEARARRAYPTVAGPDHAGTVGNAGNILFGRAALDTCAVDGRAWNETFPGGYGSEDIELMWRLRATDARCAWSPVRVCHLRRVTPTGYLRLQFRRGRGIARLAGAMRARPDRALPQLSLLWGSPQAPAAARWGRVLRDKVLGPFCRRDFGTDGRFLLYWLGGKAQGVGYLTERLAVPPQAR